MADDSLDILYTANVDSLVQANEKAATSVEASTAKMQGWFSKTTESVSSSIGAMAKNIVHHVETSEGALDHLRERMTLTAEGARISASETGSAFGALGAIMGGAILFEFLDRLKESTLQTGHLAEATGLTVVQIVELKDAMTAMGASTQRLPMQLTHLAQQMAEAANGSKQAQHEFHQLGVETDVWSKEKLPPTLDVLLKMADHLKNGTAATNELAAASHLLGRNAFETVAFLRQGSEAIRQQMQEHRAHAEAVAESVDKAKQLQNAEANLSQQFQTVMLPVFQAVVTGIQLVAAGFIKLKALLEIFGSESLYGILQLAHAVGAVATAIWQATNGNVKGAVATMKAGFQQFKDDAALAAANAKTVWDTANKSADEMFRSFNESEEKQETDSIKDKDKAAKSRLEIWKNELDEKKLASKDGHSMLLQDELAYWEQVKANNKLTLQEQLSVNSEILRMRKEVAQQTKHDVQQAEQEFLATEKEKMSELAANDAKRITLAKEVLAYEIKAHGAESKEAQRAAAEVNKIERAVATAKEKLDEEVAQRKAQIDKIMEDSERAHETASFNYKKQRVQEQLALGEISGKQALQQTIQLENQEQAAVLAHLKAEAAMYTSLQAAHPMNKEYPKQLAELNAKIRAEQDKSRALELTHDQQLATQKRQLFSQTFGAISSAFHTSVVGMIQGTQTLGQAMANMCSSILMSFVDMLITMLTTWVEKHLAMMIFGKTAGLSEAMSSAAVGATAAGASVAAIPVVGWSMVPAVTSATYGILSAQASLASAAGGWDNIPSDQVAQVHKNEMIMSAPLAEKVRNMADGGGVTLHYSPTIQAIDRRGMAGLFEDHADTMVKSLRRELERRG